MAISTWQSKRSVMPPWPGMVSPKSFILKARLKPLAKKPPNGAMTEAKMANIMACSCTGMAVKRTSLIFCARCRGSAACIRPSTSSSGPGSSSAASIRLQLRSRKMGSAGQCRRPRDRSLLGHVSHLNCDMNLAAKKEKVTVRTNPPMKPSQVFLGDSLMRGVRPKKKPARYAVMSLTMMSSEGSTYQIMPSKMLDTKKEVGMMTMRMIMWVHAYCPNW
mmetsp:Transcript_6268/g.13756  ORF Transcript_6268/g.13756 Transcript_6268/m.13756 type:complete len:219 (+) Transcript_6268:827-1483(+)